MEYSILQGQEWELWLLGLNNGQQYKVNSQIEVLTQFLSLSMFQLDISIEWQILFP